MEKKTLDPAAAAVNNYLGTLYRKLRTIKISLSEEDIHDCGNTCTRIERGAYKCDCVNATSLFHSTFQKIIRDVGNYYFNNLTIDDIYQTELALHRIFAIIQRQAFEQFSYTKTHPASERDIKILIGSTLFTDDVNGLTAPYGKEIVSIKDKNNVNFVNNPKFVGATRSKPTFIIALDCNSVMNCNHSLKRMNLLSMICIAQCAKKATEIILAAIGKYFNDVIHERPFGVLIGDKTIWNLTVLTYGGALLPKNWNREIVEPFSINLRNYPEYR